MQARLRAERAAQEAHRQRQTTGQTGKAPCTLTFEEFVCAMHPQWRDTMPWFHRAIIREVQAWWEAGGEHHLIFVLPPGHGKSYLAKLAIAWIFAMRPDEKAAYTSYGQDLADEHCGDLQNLMLSERYERAAPATRLNKRRVVSDDKRGAKRTKSLFEIVGTGGKFRAVGFGGPLTGQRVNVGAIDDPLKNPEDAASPTLRQKQWTWYTRVLRSRASPGVRQRLLLLLTRWHTDDLAGRVLKRQRKDWRLVHYPAIKIGPPTPEDPRQPGEALWPEGFPIAQLEAERDLDPEGFQALYQGMPVAEGGNVFKEVWLRRWRHLPDLDGTWLQSWDLRADGKGQNTSYAVGQLWFRPHGTSSAYLVDQVRARWTTNETLDVIRRINLPEDRCPGTPTGAGREAAARQKLWSRAGAKLVEGKADGIAVLSQLGGVVPGLIEVKPTADKITRAKAVTPYFAAGNVIIPEDAEWLPAWEGEILTFPASEQDDQVDATSQALDHMFGATSGDRGEEARARDMDVLFG